MIAVRSGSIQRCRRTIRGVWVLANQNTRLRLRAQQVGHRPRFGRHTAFVCEPCAIWKLFFEELFENMYMCCRKGWGSPFDQGESNGADVWSVGFGFWPIRTHDSDRTRGRGVGVHRPRFSGHTAFVSELCALWKHLHYLTSYFCSNENMSSSFRLQIFSTVRNHEYSGECHILVSWIYSRYDTTFN